jgi:hypothetical protein
MTKKYQKNKSKKCKIWISTGGLIPWWAPLSFRADRVLLFLSLWSAVLPRRVCPREEAQVRLLRHLTQTRDGALNVMLKLWNFYRPHLLSNWAENCCASYLSDIESEKYQKIRAKGAKFWFQQVPWPRGGLRWSFVLIVLCFSFVVICCAFLVRFSHG